MKTRLFAIYNIKWNLNLSCPGLKKITPLSVFIPSFREFVDYNLGTKGLDVKQWFNVWKLFILHFLSEQGAFVPKNEGGTEKKKKGIVFVVSFLFLCSIWETTSPPLRFTPEGSDILLHSLILMWSDFFFCTRISLWIFFVDKIVFFFYLKCFYWSDIKYLCTNV